MPQLKNKKNQYDIGGRPDPYILSIVCRKRYIVRR
jgi:hypothetical protein